MMYAGVGGITGFRGWVGPWGAGNPVFEEAPSLEMLRDDRRASGHLVDPLAKPLGFQTQGA